MEVGDENLPPSSHSWTGNPICASPRSPGAVRSVLIDVNTSVHEAKSNSETGSGTAEEEKCQAVATDPEAEAWSERTAVITRYDHETHCDLARGFVEDLADKVVAENWNKEPEPTKVKESKPKPSSLNLKKHLLFLPDLVPNVVISQTPTTDTVSESDEYESADEQPQLHETLYLDSTVNLLTGINASTPIDCLPGWHLDFESSHVLPAGDVTVDASLKDYSLPVIDRASESLSGLPQALNGESVPEEENDGLGAIKNFPQTARTTQHFSPSSGSDIDVSVVESEADTLAAGTPNNPASEVDVDLIKQFERLVLCKQAQQSPATSTLNSTFPLGENTPTAIVNETIHSVNEYEDILPADATRDVLSVTQDVSATCPDESSACPDESELAVPFTDLDQSSFVDSRAVPDPAYASALEEQSIAEISAVVEELPVVEESTAPVVEEIPIPTTEEPQLDEESTAPVVEEQLIPVSQESTTPVIEEQPAPVVEESSTPVVEEQPVPVTEESQVLEESSAVITEDPPVPATEESTTLIAEDSVSPVVEDSASPVVEDSASPVTEESIAAIVEEPQVPVAEELSALVAEESLAPVIDVPVEESTPVTEEILAPVVDVPVEEPAAQITQEVSTSVTVESLSPVVDVPIDEPTTQITQEVSTSVVEESSVPIVEALTVAEEQAVSVTEDLPDPVIGQPEIPVVQENLESAAQEPSVNEEQSVPVVEDKLSLTQDVEPAEFVHNDVDVVPADDESTVLSAAEQTVLNAADKSGTVEVNETASETCQSTVIEEVSPELPVTCQEIETAKVKPTSLPEDKPIVPKKGYDLSFLDRFDDLENATPSISQAKQLTLLSTSASESADTKVTEPHPETDTTPSVDEQQVETHETADPVVQSDTENHNIPVTIPDSETPAQDEIAVEEKSEEIIAQSNTVPDVAEEPLIVPKKGYDLSFLDKLEDLENASPPATGTSPTKGSRESAMKESMSTKENVTESTDEQPSSEAKSEKAAGSSSPAKKGPFVRKPIRPRIARPVAAAKSDPFEVEFAFDPNEDPFKSKKKLEASPTREGSPPSRNQPDANTTINADNADANDTVIESIPDSESPKTDTVTGRSSNEEGQQEEFRPAQEVFHDPSELDFLMQHGGSSNDIALARQSLFVKFDPLVTGRPSMFPTRPSDGGADETILAEDQPGGRKSAGESLFLFSPPHPTSGSASRTEKTEQAEKPPQQECLMSSRNVTGDVLSLNEHKEALKLQELLFQDKLLQKEREILMKENEIHDLKSKLEATVEAQAQMRQIVGEYEKTISQLIAEKEREKANMETTLQCTIKERDQAIEDLKEVERAFSEFHRMYERNRAAAENLHKNEEALKKALAAYQERLQQEQHKYETLKLHAAQKLEGAQQEMENLKRNLEGESSRVKAQLKKTEMRLASVESSLEQKSKENEDLTTLCDELINKLGSSAK